MLGEKFTEATGKITGTRVIPGDEHAPRIEMSFMATGSVYGVETSEIGTYVSTIQPSGTFLAEGQGITTTKDGEMISWKGFGVGKPGKGMSSSVRYSVSFQTQSTKFAKLNGFIAVGEWEVDEAGNCKGQGWEWR